MLAVFFLPICSALALKNIEANFIFLARLYIFEINSNMFCTRFKKY